ncbi:MAG TPA: hypothetical protein VI814_15210 [Candidatus Limnocylindria bacterium]
MGTRYEDQPTEQWAGPESLDPTPVWKQYLLVAILLVVGLGAVVFVGVAALAPQFVTPPALVPGDRLVLAASDIPPVGRTAKLIGAPIIDDARSFYLVQPTKGQVLALRAHWSPTASQPECRIIVASGGPPRFAATDCKVFVPPADVPQFTMTGEPLDNTRLDASTPRGLDQYLVSVSGDRVIVNLSRVIESSERTSGPVPTGIPTPQATQ